MKVITFTIICSVCLFGAANAGIISFPFQISNGVQLIPQPVLSDTGLLGIMLGNAESIVKGAVSSSQNLKCTLTEVANIKSSSDEFLTDIAACGDSTNSQVAAIISGVKTVVANCDAIAVIDKSYCYTSVTTACSSNILKPMATLWTEVSSVLLLGEDFDLTSSDACATTNVSKLMVSYMQFSTKIQSCSQLN